MNFLTMRQEVAQQLGIDQTNTNNDTLIKRWLNITQQDVSRRWPWSWMRGREVIRTVADKSTGTVSVAAAGTTVTGVNTSFASSDVGKFIQFGGTSSTGSNDWYRITAVGGPTSLTIEISYAGTSAYTSGVYIIRKWFYSTSSSCDTVMDIRNWNTPIKVDEVDYRYADYRRPHPTSVGAPYVFIPYGLDADGNVQFTLYPFPDDARNLEVRTLVRLNDLSANTDETIIPVKNEYVLIDGALWRGYAWMHKMQGAAQWRSVYEAEIDQMKKDDTTSMDDSNPFRAIDSFERIQYQRLPDGYPVLR